MAIEYLNRFENYFLTTTAQTVRFVRAVNHHACRMMYDSFHAHIEEKNQAEAIIASAAETIHVHISENDRGTPGTGQVHWDSVLRRPQEDGLQRLSDDRGLRRGAAGPGSRDPGLAKPLPRRDGPLSRRPGLYEETRGLTASPTIRTLPCPRLWKSHFLDKPPMNHAKATTIVSSRMRLIRSFPRLAGTSGQPGPGSDKARGSRRAEGSDASPRTASPRRPC